MKNQFYYGLSLIVGFFACTVIMLFHLVGIGNIADPQQAQQVIFVNQIIHCIGLLGLPFILMGLVGVMQYLGWSKLSVQLACIFYALSTIAIMFAAIVNGLIADAIAQKILHASPDVVQGLQLLLVYNHQFHQACALLFCLGSYIAIALWSAVFYRLRQNFLAMSGLIISLLAIVGVLSGHLQMSIHGFGIIMLAQFIWMTTIGIKLMKL